jgi:hypothetical protein
MKYPTLADRIIAMSVLDPEGSDCWLWLGARLKHGYGRINVAFVPGAPTLATLAHRAAYRAFTGQDPGERDVHHRCNTRWCVNPAHLTLTTHRDNCQTGKRRNEPNSGSFKKRLTASV